MRYEKIQLPYTFDSLEPYIDAETVELHYKKHLQGYVDKINKIFEGYEEFIKGKTLADILARPRKIPKEIRQTVINYGGGVINHNLFFSILYPDAKKEPTGALLKQVIKTFGSLDILKQEMSKAAISYFGAGYVFLVKDKKGNLRIISMSNQDTPFRCGYTPILNIDIWEHAYYLKYKNLRKDYVENLWEIINWAKIQHLYEEE